MLKRAIVLLCLVVPAAPGQPVRVGLAMSGGAALGFAHIGVLKVLEREGIHVTGISGNSMGSLVGGMMAAGYPAADIEDLAVNADWDHLFSSAVPFGAQYLPERQQATRYILQLRHRNLFPSLPSGLVPLQNVEFEFMRLLADIEYNTGFDFDSLPIPYRAVSVDLVTGQRQVMDRGRLAQAIRASIAIPGVFSPERLGEMQLVDGGVQQYLPVEPLLEFGPEFIIAVLTMKHTPETGISLIDVASRSMDVIGVEDLAEQQALADIVIEPDVDDFAHSDFARAAGLIAAGEAAAEAALPAIREKLAGRSPVYHRRAVPVRPLSRVKSVRFEGLGTTRESHLRPLMRTRRGTYLVFDRLRADLVRVFSTGLFEDVNYRLEFTPAGEVDLVVELVERAYGFYNIGIRYDNDDEVVVGFEVGQGNLWGSGASVRGALALGEPTEARVGLTGTRLFVLPLGYRLDTYFGTIGRNYFRNDNLMVSYYHRYFGLVAETGYIVGRDAFFDFGFHARQSDFTVPSPSVLEDTLVGPERYVAPSFRFEFNDMDDPYLPSKGLAYDFRVMYGTNLDGTGTGFLKAEASSHQVLQLTRRLRLRPGWQLGMTWGVLPWSERFIVGNPALPCFDHDEFTVPQKAAVTFGIDYLALNLFRREDYPVILQLFANAATFRRLDKLLAERDLAADLHWGAGIGVLSNSPIGPVRLAVVAEDPWKPGEDSGRQLRFQFSVGREFRYTH